jgi:uncharacterized protein YabN with tetrapyrrole methylase and pyrophosphatase domain
VWFSSKVLQPGKLHLGDLYRTRIYAFMCCSDQTPPNLSAFQRAVRIQKDASLIGFDWPRAADVLDKVAEEVEELRTALAEEDERACRRELGDLLFSAVNLARFLDADAEEELECASRRFARRFELMVQRLEKEGTRPCDCSLQQLDEAWEAVKSQEGG